MRNKKKLEQALGPPEINVAHFLGLILADYMGLVKTLTTLMLFLTTCHSTREFQASYLSDLPPQHCKTNMLNRLHFFFAVVCGATLVICLLANFLNWENKINMHFMCQSLPCLIFHGKDCQHITKEQLYFVACSNENIQNDWCQWQPNP
ncbi:hypothetical protein VP01_2125g6 [Puccinia sorghi]|uniref:SNF2 N-terminal domain-containing protein n=1 Tax=Puccinia sorghi TaxID=27349 RepID=A0A0L6VAJ6_9BASI|nr:hypothetical protein VP01_2125g6 [Puccinia sorghi]